jgi:redox-sensing transcriptional repressor
MDRMHELVGAKHIQLAIMAVPAEAAQAVTEKLVAAGIRGVLNFAPISVTVPETVSVQGVDLAVQLEQLSFKMSLSGADILPPQE